MRILAIDPGTTESAYLLYYPERQTILMPTIAPNAEVKLWLSNQHDVCDVAVCEWIECNGMPVGKEVFETVYWIGKFSEHVTSEFIRMPRRQVKMALCQSMRAKDANIRQALLDRFPATGGGSTPQVGTKAKPGPLYGISSHLWSALAIAVTYAQEMGV
jgi:hypothetical protein